MAFFNGWPWTQFQEQNLDWIITSLKKALTEIDQINSNIENYIDQIMQQWLDDGTIQSIIDQAIFESKVTHYDTFGDIPTDPLALGTICITAGYYSIGDGGGAIYIVSSSGYPANAGNYFRILGRITALKAGAHGDGSDDTAIIQDVLDAYNEIFIEAGDYVIRSPLVLSSGAVLEGDGTLIREDGTPIYIVNADTVDNITISGLTFEGGTQSSPMAMIRMRISSLNILRDLHFTNSYGYAVNLGRVSASRFENIKFVTSHGAAGDPGGAIYFHGGSDNVFDQITGYDLGDHLLYIDGSGSGSSVSNIAISNVSNSETNNDNLTSGSCIILCGDCKNVTIVNGTFTNVGAGIYFGYRDNGIPVNCAVSNIAVNGTKSSAGIFAEGDAGTQAIDMNLSISNCVIKDSKTVGFAFTNCSGVTVSGCQVIDPTTNGYMDSGADNITFMNCVAKNCPSTGFYIGVTDDCEDNNIIGCVAFNTDLGFWIRRGSGHMMMASYARGWTTGAVDNRLSDTVIYPEQQESNSLRSIIWSNAAPTYGDHRVGDICFNNGSGSPLGWRCTAAGRPGTWAAIS